MSRPQNALTATLNPTEQLQEQLLAEITRFERQLGSLKLNDDSVDFAMIQTYKELIHSRKDMLNQLPRAL